METSRVSSFPNTHPLRRPGKRARSGPLGSSGQPAPGVVKGCTHRRPLVVLGPFPTVPSMESQPRLTPGCGVFGTSSSPEVPPSYAASPPSPIARAWPFLAPLACREHSEGLSHFMHGVKAPGWISTSFLPSSSLVLFQENPFCIQDPFPPLICL